MFACLHIPDFAVEAIIRFEPRLRVRAVAVLSGRPPLEKVVALNEKARQIGVEIGGAVKNVIAIGAGVSDGLGFGHNSRAALITRGLAEITRLAIRLGAERQTLAGLAGLGDLILTCTGDLSRNRTVGLRLGAGERLADIVASMKAVAEGIRNTRSVRDLARSVDAEMPITEQMYLVLYEDKSPRQAVIDLMTRGLRRETD